MPYRNQGSDIYWISYTDACGRRTRESSGTKDKREAQALEASRKAEVRRITKFGEKPDRLFDEVLSTYLKATTAKRSHDRDLQVGVHLVSHFSGRGISTITAADIQAYKEARKAFVDRRGVHRPANDLTISKELLLLSGAIRYCNKMLDWGLPNPIAGRAPQPKRRGTPRWLTPEEVQALLQATLRIYRAPELPDFIELGLATGMRKDEILGLEWRRVSESARMIWFEGDDSKSGESQSIPLNGTALAVLRRRRAWARKNGFETSPWVFPSRKGADGGRVLRINRSFASACKIAGIKGATPHTLRHTFTSWMVQAGEDLRKVADLLRHEDIRTTMLYAHLAPKKGTESEAIDKVFLRLATAA